MKIAIIAPSAMPSRRANTIQTAKMAQAFARLGHEVLLIASPASPFRSKADETSSPLTVESGESFATSPFMGKGWGGGWNSSFAHHYGLDTPFQIAYLKPLPALRRYDFALRSLILAQRWQADLIYTRLPQAAALSSLLGIQTIFEIHDFPQGAAATWLKIFLHGKGASHLVTITHALADSLHLAFPQISISPQASQTHPFLIIAPDGVDLERYTPMLTPDQARQQLQSHGFSLPSQFIAGYTGHLYAGRGIDLILQLAQQLPEVFFLLVGGEEADRQRWQKTQHQLHLSNILLRGFVPNAELPLYQMACNVLLMPYQEQVAASSGGNIAAYLSPMKLFEYLASGRPILASDLGVFHEILNPENAILLPPQDLAAWSNAISELRNSPQKREQLGQSARQTALRYSWEERAHHILYPIHQTYQ
ncbi:MAG: glycosyltransferase family 4 protein [Anaerolineales bacterium]